MAVKADLGALGTFVKVGSENNLVSYCGWWIHYGLLAFALKRGFLTARAGRPDVYRAANFILRLVANGQIVLSFKPPEYYTN
jgi:hypothetical protein